MTASLDVTANPQVEKNISARRPPRGPLLLAALLALGWITFLAILTWKTANPVTLNLLQIQQSDVVLAGKVTGQYTIEKTDLQPWPLSEKEVSINNLPEAGAKLGQVYLFALQHHSGEGVPAHGGYRITPTHLPDGAPLIYPATSEALAQLKRIPSQPPAGPGR
jgi:hypothetical protein